jgi:hypothetical protein
LVSCAPWSLKVSSEKYLVDLIIRQWAKVKR